LFAGTAKYALLRADALARAASVFCAVLWRSATISPPLIIGVNGLNGQDGILHTPSSTQSLQNAVIAACIEFTCASGFFFVPILRDRRAQSYEQ
jgi:hypothetical protein